MSRVCTYCKRGILNVVAASSGKEIHVDEVHGHFPILSGSPFIEYQCSEYPKCPAHFRVDSSENIDEFFRKLHKTHAENPK